MSFSLREVQRCVNDARLMYRALNGVFIIYKPPSQHFNRLRETIISNLCRDLNNLRGRPMLKHVAIEGETNKNMRVTVQNSFADHHLVVGPRYQINDFKLATTKIMKQEVSGVLVCGVNKGTKLVHNIRESKCPRFYRVKGMLGRATDTFFQTGKIVEKSTFKHVKRGHIDKICSSMQSSHQRKMFELCGVDIQSQAAYELAIRGLLRPADPNIPMVYTIKCINFSPPEFTLEIVCINEDDMYLKAIVHELGMKLHSTATCTQVICIQDGLFSIKDALLPKHWILKDIVHNIKICNNIIETYKQILHQDNPTLTEPINYAPKIHTEKPFTV